MTARVLFIADYDAESGAGHLMRCAALARALMGRGVETAFCATEATARDQVEKAGAQWLGCTGIRSGSNCADGILQRFARRGGFDLAVVDSYRATDSTLRALGRVLPVACFDDLQAEALPVAAVINGNITCDESRYASLYSGMATELYLGTRYNVLRDEFSSGKLAPVKSRASDVLLSTGGSDPHDASVRIAKRMLSSPSLRGCSLHVMVGSLNRNIKTLRALEAVDGRLDIQVGVSDVSCLMRRCDYAVAAAGTTLNELCACGVPSIVYSLADNQDDCARIFAEKGAAINLGRFPGDTFFDNLETSMRCMIASPGTRREFSVAASKLFDGKGAHRLAEALGSVIARKQNA